MSNNKSGKEDLDYAREAIAVNADKKLTNKDVVILIKGILEVIDQPEKQSEEINFQPTLLIGGHQITVKQVESYSLTAQCGEYDQSTKQILISKTLSPSTKKQVLCHEIMHVLLIESGANDYLKSNGISEEAVPCLLENILYQFFSNNTHPFEVLND